MSMHNHTQAALAVLDSFKAGELNMTHAKASLKDWLKACSADDDFDSFAGAEIVISACVKLKKADFAQQVDEMIQALEETLADEPVSEVKPAVADEQPQTEAKDLTKEQKLALLADSINHELHNAAQAYMAVGKHLSEAKALFDKSKEFLDWALSDTGLKKSQVYNLIRIYSEFGQDERFADVGMRVLLVLSGADKAVKEVAAEMAEAGELDSGTVNSLFTQDEPEDQDETESAKVTDNREEQEEAPEHVLRELEASKALVLQLTSQISELTKELAAMSRKKQSIKCLPHFRSPDFHIRLGLPANFSSAQLRKAYRETVAVFNEDSCPEAFTLITEAYECLNEVLKAA